MRANFEWIIAQPPIVESLATFLSDRELVSVAETCGTAYDHILGPMRIKSLRKKTQLCDGTVAQQIQQQTLWGEVNPCEDVGRLGSVGERCVRCSRLVCNACRFHISRRIGLPSPVTSRPTFQDERDLARQRRLRYLPLRFRVDYGGWARRSIQEPTEKLMTNHWQTFCDFHLPKRKEELAARKLEKKSAGALCQCSALERYVGKWICEPCFANEVAVDQSRGWIGHCADCPGGSPQCGNMSWRLWKLDIDGKLGLRRGEEKWFNSAQANLQTILRRSILHLQHNRDCSPYCDMQYLAPSSMRYRANQLSLRFLRVTRTQHVHQVGGASPASFSTTSLQHNPSTARNNRNQYRKYFPRHLYGLSRRHIHTENAAATAAIEQHTQEVKQIAASVRGFYDRNEAFRIFHGSTNSTRKSAVGRDPKKVVDTSRLNRVLHVDITRQTALVEPNVPMDRLAEATLRHGLVPPVVMEFPGITAGGGYAGTSGESSSFKHGFFNKTLKQVEMVLANGEVVTCSESERPDLFHGAAGALGTFGVTTLVEIQLHKAAKFVETTYHPVSSMDEAIEKSQTFTATGSEYDYVDGIMYSQTQGAIVTGRLTDTPYEGLPIQRFSHAKDPWFYLHVQDRIADSSDPVREAIPLPEYLFRYDRGGFWVGVAAFDYFRFPFNSLTRWWLDDFLHTRMLYKALHGSGESDRMIIQDLALPYATAKKFVKFTDERTGIWPLWLCPLRQSPLPTMHPHLNEYEADGETLKPMLNIGLWGMGPKSLDQFIEMNKDIEQKLQELGGMRWLYAQTFHSETEFWQDFDREWYETLREKYHATSLPTVYEKVRRDPDALSKGGSTEGSWLESRKDTWPFGGLLGLKKAIQSKDYVAARKSEWKDWVPRY